MTNPLYDTRSDSERVRDSVKEYFKLHKISLKDVALKADVSPAMLSYYLSGKNLLPKTLAQKLSELYGFDRYFLEQGTVEILHNIETGNEVRIPHELFPTQQLSPLSLFPYTSNHITPKELDDAILHMHFIIGDLEKKYRVAERNLCEANRILLGLKHIVSSLMAVREPEEEINSK